MKGLQFDLETEANLEELDTVADYQELIHLLGRVVLVLEELRAMQDFVLNLVQGDLSRLLLVVVFGQVRLEVADFVRLVDSSRLEVEFVQVRLEIVVDLLGRLDMLTLMMLRFRHLLLVD